MFNGYNFDDIQLFPEEQAFYGECLDLVGGLIGDNHTTVKKTKSNFAYKDDETNFSIAKQYYL